MNKIILIFKILFNTDEQFISLSDLANKLKISVWTLGLITGNFFVIDCTVNSKIDENTKLENLQHWNIGLLLKSKTGSEKMILPGYTRYIGNPHSEQSPSEFWEFSTAAVELINEYIQKFKFVVDSLERYREMYVWSSKFFKIFELFSRETDIYKKLNEICIWKNTHPISKTNFTTIISDFISRKDCRKIEDYLEKKVDINIQENKDKNDNAFNNTKRNNEISNKSTLTDEKLVVNPNYLFQENYPWIPPFYNYEPTGFELGDRVINIRSSDIPAIPFGIKGVITGVTEKFVEVCFDYSFFGGTTCNGRFKSNRGAIVKPTNLLNLTNKYPVFLRRNSQKYYSWNHEPQGDLTYEKNISHYALPKGDLNLTKQASEKPALKKKIILRKPKEISESEAQKKEKLIVIEKHLGKEIESSIDLELKISKSDNNFDDSVTENKVKEIISHAKVPINASNVNYNLNNPSEQKIDFKAIPKTNINLEDLKNKYNANTNRNENKIKKIYRRDNKNNFFTNNQQNDLASSNDNGKKIYTFARKYDQYYMKEDEMNFKNKANCSEYNQENRKFKNENIPSNSFYYFKSSAYEENDNVKNNKNIIKTIVLSANEKK